MCVCVCHTHIHTYMNVIIVDEKGAMNLRTRRDIERVWRKERKIEVL